MTVMVVQNRRGRVLLAHRLLLHLQVLEFQEEAGPLGRASNVTPAPGPCPSLLPGVVYPSADLVSWRFRDLVVLFIVDKVSSIETAVVIVVYGRIHRSSLAPRIQCFLLLLLLHLIVV